MHFWQLFKACDNNYFAQIAHILGNYCKDVSGIIFGQLLQTFGDFLLVTLLKEEKVLFKVAEILC